MANFSISPEKSKLPRKLAAATLGVVMLAGVAGAEDYANKHQTPKDVKHFTFKGLSDHSKDISINSKEVNVQHVGDFETPARQVTEDLHAKNVETVSQETRV